MRAKARQTIVGVWIDGREATFVWLQEDEAAIAHLVPQLGREQRSAMRSSRGMGRSDRVSENKTQARWRQELTGLVEQASCALRGADEIVLMGPGRAKWELQKVLVEQGRGACIVSISAAERLTDRQLLAQVRQGFGKVTERAARPLSQARKAPIWPKAGHVPRPWAERDPRPQRLSARQDIAAWLE